MILLITLMLFGQADSMHVGFDSYGDQDIVLNCIESDRLEIRFHTFEYTRSVEDGVTIYKTSDAWTATSLIGMYEYSKNVVVAFCSTYTGGSSKDKGIPLIFKIILPLIPVTLLAVGYWLGYRRGRSI